MLENSIQVADVKQRGERWGGEKKEGEGREGKKRKAINILTMLWTMHTDCLGGNQLLKQANKQRSE